MTWRASRRRIVALVATVPAWGRARFAGARATPDAALLAAAARALALRDEAIRLGDQPYGAVVLLEGRIVGEGVSAVVRMRDPSAHAERLALRDAASRLGRADLAGAMLVGSSRACAACSDAASRAGIVRLFHGAEAEDDGPPRLSP